MSSYDKILDGLSPDEYPETETPFDDTKEKLRRAKKKLIKAKKKGKKAKKLRRKVKKLKAQLKCLKLLNYSPAAASQPVRGRWDGVIEKSIPEVIKLATTLANRRHPRPTRPHYTAVSWREKDE